ncbi:MAG TPA: alpha/beta hydrolase [Candidatus Acidoferrum sp.]|jgi:dipeptidyl aminopeptidase/acylaminoacyl peptidase|nr:alpha/beta hydrolase [Candidatus Acidoferrum sp.]
MTDTVRAERTGTYEPYGWHHWPDHPWMSYQFRRALGETQEGGGAISECFQAASKMIPGDKESWYREWLHVAERNRIRAEEAEKLGHIITAKQAWLRAVDYYRQAEFWLDGEDPRRLEVFTKCEQSFQAAGKYFRPKLEPVQIPYEDGKVLYAYFLRAPRPKNGKQPVLISFGGLDSFKEELYFMTARGALDRGISQLLVDGPGQGGTIRRQKLINRYDYEVPVGKCIDYLETRDDVDTSRIAISGTSLGGYYAARAGSFEHRLKAVISHGAIWDVNELWSERGEEHGLADHIKWVFGTKSVAEAIEKGKKFRLEGVLDGMKCPYLIIHGGHDVLGVKQASTVYEYAKKVGVDATLRLLSAEETGAEHCQHDNPTIGEEEMMDWLAEKFGIDQAAVLDS